MVVVGALVGGLFLAHQAWFSRSPFMPETSVPDLLVAAKYLEHTEPGHPVVFVTNNPALPWRGFIPGFRRLRAFAPTDHIGDIYMYPGTVYNALNGVPTEPKANVPLSHLSERAWPQLHPIMQENPTIVLMRLYYPDFDSVAQQHPDWKLTSRLMVSRGPHVSASELTPGTLTLPPDSSTLVWKTIAILALLFGVGLGWSSSLVPAGWLVKGGTAPAFAIAALATAGLVADRLGFRLVGGSGVAIVVIVGALGWAGHLKRFLPKRGETSKRESPGEPAPEPA